MKFIRNIVAQTQLSSATVKTRPVPLAQIVQAARREQASGNWSEACALWQKSVDAEPENCGYWLQLGNMRNELGEYESALAAFAKARSLEPENPDTVAGLAGVCERSGAWTDAAGYWHTAIELLLRLPAQASDRDARLKHAFRHAAMSELNAGRTATAAEALIRGSEVFPDFSADRAQFRLRSQLIRAADPLRAQTLLREYLRDYRDDRAAAYEYAEATLADGNYEDGLAVLRPVLAATDIHIDFLWLAADLNERLQRWREVIALCEAMIARRPDDKRYYQRCFEMQRRGRDIRACRRTALRYVARFDSLDLVHGLISIYEDAAEYDHARLLCRWLKRAWPHSKWHEQHYINLVAVSKSLAVADQLIRAYIEKNGRDRDIEVIYCMAAYRSGNYLETKRRLKAYVESQAEDTDRQMLLGYVLANTDGIDVAEAHFADLAVRSFQAKGPLIGLAHMAMRRRDPYGTLERWRHVVTLYPQDTIGRVEFARAAYELRRFDLARETCEAQLRRLPRDVTMAEFYVWLLVAMGCASEAAARIRDLQKTLGASWATLELAVQAAAQLGRLDAEADAILANVPSSSSFDDAKRFYHVVRQLWCAGRPNLLRQAVAQVRFEAKDVPWLHAYVAHAPGMVSNALALQTVWARHRALVRSDISEQLGDAQDAEIAAIVDRPVYEQPVIHIVNKFEQISGGSELHALDVAAKLARHARVELWAPEMPHPHFSKKFNVQGIEPGQGRLPHDGIIVLVGVYFDVAAWIGYARPSRVIILYNTFEAPLLFKRIAEIHAKTGVKTELLYCSNMMGEEVGLPGFFEPSPIDIELFIPPSAPPPPGRFVLGRHSRDVIEKHHPEDWKIYQAVAQAGGQSRVLGGTCMEAMFPPLQNTELLPARSQGMVSFLQGLDCYLYRTSTWIEPWGRVVIEAMACGVPVVASRIGGYAEVIEHDVNGLLFDTTEQAVACVQALAADPARRRRLGAAGRKTVEGLLGPRALRRIVAFYLAN